MKFHKVQKTTHYGNTRKEGRNMMLKIFEEIMTENFQYFGKLLMYTHRNLNTVRNEKNRCDSYQSMS
jgi:hypothetical protein